jgi:hypothetical protein
MPNRNAERAGRSSAQGTPHAPPVRHGRLASRDVFYSRVRRGAGYGLALVFVALVVGMVGYHVIEAMNWVDAFHQSSLLLSGVGSNIDMKTVAGKIFDAIYAVFCGVILLVATGFMFAPVIHRLLHRFHLEDAGER